MWYRVYEYLFFFFSGSFGCMIPISVIWDFLEHESHTFLLRRKRKISCVTINGDFIFIVPFFFSVLFLLNHSVQLFLSLLLDGFLFFRLSISISGFILKFSYLWSSMFERRKTKEDFRETFFPHYSLSRKSIIIRKILVLT